MKAENKQHTNVELDRSETFFEIKQQVLFPEGFLGVLTDFSQITGDKELQKNARTDIFTRYKEEWNWIKGQIEPEKQREAEEKMVEILALYNFGIRLANEVLIVGTHPKSTGDFGELFRIARRNPKNFDHGDLHERGIDATQLLLYIITGHTKHVDDATGLSIIAAPMKSIFHDQPQLWMEDRKDAHAADERFAIVNPKYFHTEAGAVLIQVLRPIIQKVGHLSDDLTDRFLSVVSTGISAHDNSEKIQTILLGENKQNADRYSNQQDLYVAYKSGELDRLSLTAPEWFMILRERVREVAIAELTYSKAEKIVEKKIHKLSIQNLVERMRVRQEMIKSTAETIHLSEKQLNDHVAYVYGAYGFGEEFEKYYTDEIAAAIQNNRRPDWSMSPFTREALYMGDFIFNLADNDEMIRGSESYVRKLRVHWSRNRGLAITATDVHEATRPDPVIIAHNQSDWCRQAFEWMLIAKLYAKSPFFENPAFAEYITNTYLRNMIQAQALFEALAQGESGLRWLDTMKIERVLQIAKKALKKSGVFQEKQLETIIDYLSKNSNNIWEITEYIEELLRGNTYYDRFCRQFERIDSQIDTVKENLRQKPGSDGKIVGYVYKYSQEDIGKLQSNFNEIWIYVCEIFGITDKKQQEHKRHDLGDGERTARSISREHPMMRRIHMDSVGALSDARTINTLSDETERKLRETDN